MSTSIIGVDWGTTNLRAFRFGADGAVLDARRAAAGLNAVVNRAFEQKLLGVIEDWIGGDARIVISGMAGSREGWVEAPYVPCPADLDALARAMIPAPASCGEVWLVPGLRAEQANGLTEVMRGEETQIFGAIETRASALVIAPGTHSKWARIEAGRVSDTRTYMTGELFALLKSHSILGRLIQGDAPNEEAFLRGAERGLADAALLNLLFSVRTEGLFERIAPDALSAYLSGLLIGSEAAEGLSLLKLERNAPILVVGAGDIAGLYKRVLAFSGAENVSVVDGEQAAARGLWRLAQIKAAA